MMTKRLKFAVLIGAALAFTGCAAIQNAVETSAISDGKVGLNEFSNLSSTSDQSVDNTAFDQFLAKYLVTSDVNNSVTQGLSLIHI